MEIKDALLGETRGHVEGGITPHFCSLLQYQKMKRHTCGLFCEGVWFAVTKPISLPLQLPARPRSQTPLQSCASVNLSFGQWNVDRSEGHHAEV